MATEPADKPTTQPANKLTLPERLRAQRERHLLRPKPIRLLYIVAGFTILIAGIAMLLAPGPAFVVIPIGLAVLSLEFAWAERLLDTAIAKGEAARRKARATSTRERVLTIIAVLLAGGAVAVWGVWGDIPLLPF